MIITYQHEPWSNLIPKLMKGTTVTDANPPNSVWFTARVDGKLVGCCCIVPKKNVGRIKSLVVLPEYRGYKIGRQLWDYRMNYAKKMGLKKLNGFASPYSQPMYMKAGFILKKVIKRADRETWYMEKEL